MKKIAFTICSNNYLAQAKVLYHSLIKHNSDYLFYIVLLDTLSSIPPELSISEHIRVIEASELGIKEFESMNKNYNIIELNTAIKPFAFKYLFENFNPNHVVYFDPDIRIYYSFEELDSILMENNIILTPHVYETDNNGEAIPENKFLNYGLYNLGFIAVKNSIESIRFINWWMDKLETQCLMDSSNGFYVDQLWINFVPLFFEKVNVLQKPGYNMAFWNMHQRFISIENDREIMINRLYPLVFFHFSSFDIYNSQSVFKNSKSTNINQRPDLAFLINEYKYELIENKIFDYKNIPCFYSKKIRKDIKWSIIRVFMKLSRIILKRYRSYDFA